MDAALLAGAHADGLAVFHVAHGVGLGVLQGDEGDNQIPLGLLGEGLVLGGQVFQQAPVDFQLVAALLKGDAEHVLVLHRGGLVLGVNLHHVVAALALLLQDGQGLIGVAGGDDAVGHLPLQQQSGLLVAHVGESRPVAVGGHAVRAPGGGIGAGQGGKLQVIHKVDFLQGVGKGHVHGGASGADVLKGSGGGQAGGLLQLLDQLPAVEGVQKVDVAGLAV